MNAAHKGIESVARRRRDAARRVADRIQVAPRSHARQFLSEAVFKGVLARERRRTDRSNQHLIVMTVSARPSEAQVEPVRDAIIEAVWAATRETDVTGWLQSDAIISAIVPEVHESPAVVAARLEERLRAELERRVSGAAAYGLSVQACIHATQPDGEAEASSPLPTMDAPWSMRRQAYTVMKRALDILGSFVLLALLLPLFAVIALLVKLTSPGPVLFRQVRIGYKGKPFTMLKFRTMRINVDHAVHLEFVTNFIKASGAQKASAGTFFKIAKDPRVTSIGRFLRKTSFDELPQFWNVLIGDMSLVGPRPPLQYEVDQYAAWHRRRVFEAKPGVTGLWQVTGRSRTTFDEMVRLDLQYAKTCSITTDVKILLATPAAVVTGKGAC